MALTVESSENFEHLIAPEAQITSQIDLDFARHDQKEKAQSVDPTDKTPEQMAALELEADRTVRLTADGRKHATATSPNKPMDYAVAYYSGRDRTGEEAARHLIGNQRPDVTNETSFEELQDKLKTRVGSKLHIEQRLDFDEGTGSFQKDLNHAYNSGYLQDWFVGKSDALAVETGQKIGVSTYSTMAKNVAEIIQRYFYLGKRVDEIREAHKVSPEEATMRRYFGTHTGVGESFLEKAIELTDGVEARDKLVEAFKKQGFGFSEGFRVVISNYGQDEQRLRIIYEKTDQSGATIYALNKEITDGVLQEIIRQGKELEQKLIHD